MSRTLSNRTLPITIIALDSSVKNPIINANLWSRKITLKIIKEKKATSYLWPKKGFECPSFEEERYHVIVQVKVIHMKKSGRYESIDLFVFPNCWCPNTQVLVVTRELQHYTPDMPQDTKNSPPDASLSCRRGNEALHWVRPLPGSQEVYFVCRSERLPAAGISSRETLPVHALCVSLFVVSLLTFAARCHMSQGHWLWYSRKIIIEV